jgi:pimeloyl-ACP methyl ester carboxylesterase
MYESDNLERAMRPVLLPGLLCDARLWAAQHDALAPFDPLIVPGYGPARTIRDMALHVLESAPPKMALVGHGLGARVALEMVLISPERIGRLALLALGDEPPRPEEAVQRDALLALGRAEGIGRLLDRWLPRRVAAENLADKALLARLRAMCETGGLARFEAQTAALLARPDVLPLLPGIRCPTLVGAGRGDLVGSPALHEAIAAAIPGATFAIFEHCGHMAPLEAPDQVGPALARWLGATAITDVNL